MKGRRCVLHANDAQFMHLLTMFRIVNHNDHVTFRDPKLTRMLQPSLSDDARIPVIYTTNPSKNAVAETATTLLFAQRIERVQVPLSFESRLLN